VASSKENRGAGDWFATATLGRVLGLLTRRDAEDGAQLLQRGLVAQLLWAGDVLEGVTSDPLCRVLVEEMGGRLTHRCSLCPPSSSPCGHAAAVLLKWVELRTAMLRMGVGTTWRAQGGQKFLPPKKGTVPYLELGDQLGVTEILEGLRYQLQLQGPGGARLVAAGERLELQLTTSSGARRVVGLPVRVLPDLLAARANLPPFTLEGELAQLSVSPTPLQPVLLASVPADGTLVLEPVGEGAGGRQIPLPADAPAPSGGWLREGDTFFRLRPLPAEAAGVFCRGRRTLTGAAAERFLAVDHVAALGKPWYRPVGTLAARTLPTRATTAALEVEETEDRRLRLRPLLANAEQRLSVAESARVVRHRFITGEGGVLLAPDLQPLERAGFKARRGVLEGDTLALLRAAADLRVPVRTSAEAVAALVDAVLTPPPEAPLPPSLASHLRPYQRQGYAWLRRLSEAGLGGLLADEMGLGKTHQAMALLCSVHEQYPQARALVVCPRGVLEHWHHLLQRFAPRLPVSLYHGPDRQLPANGGGVVLTTYEVAVRSLAQLAAVPWRLAIFDEAQRLKNAATKGARAVKAFPARVRVALTGTPIENNLAELWSVMDLVLPGYLGSQRAFAATYRAPSSSQLEQLQRQLAPFVLRRVKAEVLRDLPPKSEDIVYCPLTPEQGVLYRQMHDQGRRALAPLLADRQQDVPYIHIFALLSRLKQICDHPALVEPSWGGAAPGKYEVLDEALDEALEAGRRVVVFSQYVAMIDLLSRHLARRRLPHLTMTGQTRQRAAVVERFNRGGEERILLASLLASGVGIDLTAASVVIHYDRWWNPAREDQASDRVHRIGQLNPVRVVKLVTVNTIEERIEALLESKRSLAREVVAPTADVLGKLTREELAELLEVSLAPAAVSGLSPTPPSPPRPLRRGRRPRR